ncbi:DUF1704 domain-containing protein [Candidatus Woesearchaeota archaeon]|nr:DUF1704 domain-containing protein [Candidatus Woesearchaeota archaeon]
MINLQKYNLLDDALLAAAKEVKPLYYVEPINEKEQKQEFLAGKVGNPSFQYKPLEYNPAEVQAKLESIEVPDGLLGGIFQIGRRNALLDNELIENRGKCDIVRNNTTIIYGVPSEPLVAYADELLRQTPEVDATKEVAAESVKEALERALVSTGLTDWAVELSDKRLTTVYQAEKKITICRTRKFGDKDPARLCVHEVGVHTLRAVNGYEQPLKIFALGLPGYLPTEEGLTSYFEEITGNSDSETIRDYAARVIAVDSVVKGLDFSQTFDRLKSYELTDDRSWNLAVRAHRAGGYIKDHVYLEGLLKVRDFAKQGGDFKTLYVGKVGIEDLPLVRALLEENVLTEARYLPAFIR